MIQFKKPGYKPKKDQALFSFVHESLIRIFFLKTSMPGNKRDHCYGCDETALMNGKIQESDFFIFHPAGLIF